jgi:hypothetical protein
MSRGRILKDHSCQMKDSSRILHAKGKDPRGSFMPKIRSIKNPSCQSKGSLRIIYVRGKDPRGSFLQKKGYLRILFEEKIPQVSFMPKERILEDHLCHRKGSSRIIFTKEGILEDTF